MISNTDIFKTTNNTNKKVDITYHLEKKYRILAMIV